MDTDKVLSSSRSVGCKCSLALGGDGHGVMKDKARIAAVITTTESRSVAWPDVNTLS